MLYHYNSLSNTFGLCGISLFKGIPTVGGIEINFSQIKQIEFLAEKNMQIISLEGTNNEHTIVDPPGTTPCMTDGWRLTGKTTLGNAEIPLIAINKIIMKQGIIGTNLLTTNVSTFMPTTIAIAAVTSTATTVPATRTTKLPAAVKPVTSPGLGDLLVQVLLDECSDDIAFDIKNGELITGSGRADKKNPSCSGYI